VFDPECYPDRFVRNADGTLNYIVTGNANLGIVEITVSMCRWTTASEHPYGQFGLGLQGTYVDVMTSRAPSKARSPTRSAISKGTRDRALETQPHRQLDLAPQGVADQPFHQRLQRLRPRYPCARGVVFGVGPVGRLHLQQGAWMSMPG
jgi:hypothetical protein